MNINDKQLEFLYYLLLTYNPEDREDEVTVDQLFHIVNQEQKDRGLNL